MRKGPGGRYAQITDGDWVRWDKNNNRICCCDCSLVHELDYRVVGREKHVEAKYVRDDKATDRARKRAGIIIKRVNEKG